MNPIEIALYLSGVVTLPLWALMILWPRWALSKRVMASLYSLVPAALLYAALVFTNLPAVLAYFAHPTVETTASLFGTPHGAVMAWAHIGAFDLFVGRWAYLDSQERPIASWIMSVILVVCLMIGPVGFLLYLIVRQGVDSRSPKKGSSRAAG